MQETVFKKNKNIIFYPHGESTYALSLSSSEDEIIELAHLCAKIFEEIDGKRSIKEINQKLNIQFEEVKEDYLELIDYLKELKLIQAQ